MDGSEDRVREAGYAIRDSLTKLFTAQDAAALARDLTEALDRSRGREPGDAGSEVEQILLRHDSTRVLLQFYLEKGTLPAALRGYQPPPGHARFYAGTKYRCPEADCDITFVQDFVGEPVPECARHKIPLVRV